MVQGPLTGIRAWPVFVSTVKLISLDDVVYVTGCPEMLTLFSSHRSLSAGSWEL